MSRSLSPVLRIGVQVTTPIAIVLGTYLLFAGHNRPGGGFTAGLVFSAVVTLRMLAGLQKPPDAMRLTAFGILIVAGMALAPVVVGEVFLDQAVVEGELPVLGKVKSGSALPFDIGVAAIVVGLSAALLTGLGNEMGDDAHQTEDGTA